MITHKQLTLAEVFEDCQNKFDNDKYQFLSLLDKFLAYTCSHDAVCILLSVATELIESFA